MAVDVLNLLFSPDSRTKITGVIDVPIDAATVIGHTKRNRMTEEVVESGAPISDHIVSELDTLTLECFVSDFPVEIFGGVLGGAVLGTLGDFDGIERPSRTVWELVKEIHNKHLLVRVDTTLESYEDMLSVELRTTQVFATANALRFNWTLRKRLTVNTEEGSPIDQLVDVIPGGSDLASSTQDRGQRPAETPTSSEATFFFGAGRA